MPPRNAPGAKNKNGINPDNGKSFNENLTTNDGTELMVRRKTYPGNNGHDVSQTSQRVPVSSKPTQGQVTPGKWRTKNKIDGKC